MDRQGSPDGNADTEVMSSAGSSWFRGYLVCWALVENFVDPIRPAYFKYGSGSARRVGVFIYIMTALPCPFSAQSIFTISPTNHYRHNDNIH